MREALRSQIKDIANPARGVYTISDARLAPTRQRRPRCPCIFPATAAGAAYHLDGTIW